MTADPQNAAKTSITWALKEWAAVCEAIAAGRQTILLRKGGIHERGGVFAPDHEAVWLFPPHFHQDERQLSIDGRSFLQRARDVQSESKLIQFLEHVEVIDVMEIRCEELLPRFRPYHIYADQVLADRFHYRRPGLTMMIVRASATSPPVIIVDSPHFGGCRSWVDLPGEIETQDLQPVLDDAEFERTRREIRRAATPPTT
ncbi:MAG: DUF1802 family protein [Planctomycetaceae bacterium]|nr:DUF1802 family protein [Planctomycetaceae bacterium]